MSGFSNSYKSLETRCVIVELVECTPPKDSTGQGQKGHYAVLLTAAFFFFFMHIRQCQFWVCILFEVGTLRFWVGWFRAVNSSFPYGLHIHYPIEKMKNWNFTSKFVSYKKSQRTNVDVEFVTLASQATHSITWGFLSPLEMKEYKVFLVAKMNASLWFKETMKPLLTQVKKKWF